MSVFWPQLSQQIINGLTLGSIYALIAIGYTMVYGIIGMINFAHGEIYMIGAYIGVVTLTALSMAGFDMVSMGGVATSLGIAMIAAIMVTALYGWSIERVAYRPLRGGPRLIPLISAIGMSIFLQNYMHLAQGSRDVAVPALITGGWQFASESGFTVYLSYIRVIIGVVSLGLMIALTLFIRRSSMGRACRACSQDMGMAGLLGIDTNRVVALTFVLGAAMAAVAGVLIGLYVGKVNPYIGFEVGIKAFTAAVLGGIGSLPGAMLGGLLLGLTESFASDLLPTEYKDVVAFSLLVLVLLFRPTGLLGKPELEKV